MYEDQNDPFYIISGQLEIFEAVCLVDGVLV